MTNRSGYTLIEICIATAISVAVLSVATGTFVGAAQFIGRIENVAAKTEVAQSLLLWSVAQRSPADYPKGMLPKDVATDEHRRIQQASTQRRGMIVTGFSSITDLPAYAQVEIHDANYDNETFIRLRRWPAAPLARLLLPSSPLLP